MAVKDETGLVALVAHNVRERRRLLGLSQEALADEAGIDRTYVSQIERRIPNVTITMLALLARALKTTPDQLLIRQRSGSSPLRRRAARRAAS